MHADILVPFCSAFRSPERCKWQNLEGVRKGNEQGWKQSPTQVSTTNSDKKTDQFFSCSLLQNCYALFNYNSRSMNFFTSRLLGQRLSISQQFVRGLKPKAKRVRGKLPEEAKNIDTVLKGLLSIVDHTSDTFGIYLSSYETFQS